MGIELKPCPFCGGAGQISRDSVSGWEMGCAEWITCPYSPAEIFNTEAEAVAAWNTRADDREAIAAAVSAERRRIVAALESDLSGANEAFDDVPPDTLDAWMRGIQWSLGVVQGGEP